MPDCVSHVAPSCPTPEKWRVAETRASQLPGDFKERGVRELGMYRNAFSKEGMAAWHCSPFSHSRTWLAFRASLPIGSEMGRGIIVLSLFQSWTETCWCSVYVQGLQCLAAVVVVVCSGSFAPEVDRFCWSLFRVDCIVGGGEGKRAIVKGLLLIACRGEVCSLDINSVVGNGPSAGWCFGRQNSFGGSLLDKSRGVLGKCTALCANMLNCASLIAERDGSADVTKCQNLLLCFSTPLFSLCEHQ